jgi:tetratricopeptide (TPR) repeat protein
VVTFLPYDYQEQEHAMPRRKLPKQMEVIEPGKMLQLQRSIQAFIVENIRQVAAVGLIIAVVAGGTGLWQYKKAQAEEQAQALFFTALNRYNSPDKPAGKGEAAPLADDAYRQALGEFKKVTQQFPETRAGSAALLYAGTCSYRLGKDEDALTCYQDFLKKTGEIDTYLRPFAYEGVGAVYERKGDYKKALEWFEKQDADTKGAMTMMAPLNRARCYTALGDQERACKAYQDFLEKYPSSSFAETAKIGVAEHCAGKQK